MAETKNVRFKISLAVLGGLTPQRSMLNADKSDLEDQTFELVEMVAPRGRDADDIPDGVDGESDENSGRVRFRYRNVTNKKTLVLSTRQLLYMNGYTKLTVADAKKDLKKDDSREQALYEMINEKFKGLAEDAEKTVDIPFKIEVVQVDNAQRETVAGEEVDSYPSFMYELFDQKVKGMTNEQRNDVYDDRDFMNSLIGSPLAVRYNGTLPGTTKAEPIKALTAVFYMEDAA
jgi:hypothetical protein